MISYIPLWKQLIEHHMTKEQLRKEIGISSQTMASMSKDKCVNLKYIDRICKLLGCRIEDVIEYREDDPNDRSESVAQEEGRKTRATAESKD